MSGVDLVPVGAAVGRVGPELLLQGVVDGVELADALQEGDEVKQLAVVHVVEPGGTGNLEITFSSVLIRGNRRLVS